MRTVTWVADEERGADVVVLASDRGPWVLVDIDGHTGNQAAPTGVSAPRQMGQTPVGVVVSPRVLTLTMGVVAEDQAALVEMRRSLAHAFTDEPAVWGATPRPGTLRFQDEDGLALEIDAYPQGGLQVVSLDPTQTMEVFDTQLWCPDPRWKALADIQYDFIESDPGGLEFPVEFPLSMDALFIATTVDNVGTVSTPVLLRLWGESTNPRIRNGATGELIQIVGDIPEGSYVEVNTAFGAKSVTLVDADSDPETRSEALGMVDTDVSTFWSLRPGEQTVYYEADSNVSGYAEMFFRPRYMAV